MTKISEYSEAVGESSRQTAVITSDASAAALVQQAITLFGGSLAVFPSTACYLEHASSDGCLVVQLQDSCHEGLDLMRRLRFAKRFHAVIFIGRSLLAEDVVRLMQEGAVSVLEQPCSFESLVDSLQRAWHRGNQFRELLSPALAATERLQTLSSHEREVLNLIIRGIPNKVAASELGVSERTIERRREMLLKKLNVGSTPELATLVAEAKFATMFVRHYDEGWRVDEGHHTRENGEPGAERVLNDSTTSQIVRSVLL